jgi:hypothetical protein
MSIFENAGVEPFYTVKQVAAPIGSCSEPLSAVTSQATQLSTAGAFFACRR